MDPRVTVVTPVYHQAAFVGRAVGSLCAQDQAAWELVVVDDGSPDDIDAALAQFAPDPRIRLERLPDNRGLGAALNRGLDTARAPVVAYLPADDLLDPEHLDVLLATLDARPDVELAVTGRRGGEPDGVQLVQLAHRRTSHRWLERDAVESDDLERLLLDRLGPRASTGRVTCEWVQHPGQRHRAIRDSRDGGLNAFRARYRVATPLRLAASDGAPIDEAARYAHRRARPPRPPSADGLTILVAGELAYNPERIQALADRGHRLLGLWIPDPLGFMTVGPLPFPGVEDVTADTWQRERPDVIYALLNWRAVPLAASLLGRGVPIVWHFKEAPQRSLVRGEWPLLAELHARAAARLYCSDEQAAFMEAALPGRADPATTHVLDGDLPPADRFGPERAPRLSARDGAPHTAAVGRPQGMDAAFVAGLAARGIHLHVHAWSVPAWLTEAAAAHPTHVHLEAPVEPADWTRVLSRYDAGWLHPWRSANGGDVRRAAWEDLNVPARLPTLLAAGLPVVAPDNAGAVVATQRLAADFGVFYDGLDDLHAQLANGPAMAARSAAAWERRAAWSFDAHVDRLDAILRAADRVV